MRPAVAGTITLRGKEIDVTPLGDRVILTVPPIKEYYGSLWIPPEAEWYQKQLQGEIIAVGPLCADWLAPGLRVITSRFGRVHLDTEGLVWVTSEDYLICTIDWDEEIE